MGTTTEHQQTSTSRGTIAFRAMSCCAILSIGVFSNLPINLQDSAASVSQSLRGGSSTAKPTTMFVLPANETDYAGFHDNETNKDEIALDFYVAGFPKCGTTTLLRTFAQHEETVVPPMEECSLDVVFQDDYAYTRLQQNLKEATNRTDPNLKRGIKCPFGLTTAKGIERLEDWFPSTKLIFGVRHPVFFFQSFYNYRILEVNQGKQQGPIPSPESLIGSVDWIRVSTDNARFERVLSKLGKTAASKEPSTPFKVFLYTLEQMEDDDEERGAQLRKTLGDFLDLKKPIEPLEASNINTYVGNKGFPETIDICDTKHDALRNVLVENGKKTQEWILNEFIKSPDVTVANEGHFAKIISDWGSDPCDATKESVVEKKP
jgi:hypothetical protein